MESSDHLFRREAGRLVAVLTRIFGPHNLALAEDVVQDAFCRALEVWRFEGVPEHPSAWLMATAKHRALDLLRRERTARKFAPELGWQLETEWTLAPAVAERFTADGIQDDQLRMMFSCCDPRIPEEARIALVLNIVCAFSAGEIAGAFLCGEAAVEKRISRGKKVLRESRRLFDLDDGDFRERLSTVQRALYLLFNEGYHGASEGPSVRPELCFEAMHLVSLLRQNPLASTPATNALAALMSLHAARLPARVDASGGPDIALRAGSVAMGFGARNRRVEASRPLGGGRGVERVSPGSRDRRGARIGVLRGGHELARDHRDVRSPARASAVAGRGSQPGHCGRASLGPRRRARGDEGDPECGAPGGLSVLLRRSGRAGTSTRKG